MIMDTFGKSSTAHPALLEGFARTDGKPLSSKSIGNQLVKDLDRVSGGRWVERVFDAGAGMRTEYGQTRSPKRRAKSCSELFRGLGV